IEVRGRAIQDGLKQAVMVPLNTAELSLAALKTAQRVVEIGNRNSSTDAGVGAQIAFTGVRGGIYNVLINLPQIADKKFIQEMKKKCDELETTAQRHLDETTQNLNRIIEQMLK
ncbi:MAG: cyclodeaminase/cyclohydrolase family protein, partial [Calditrichota bacterium]